MTGVVICTVYNAMYRLDVKQECRRHSRRTITTVKQRPSSQQHSNATSIKQLLLEVGIYKVGPVLLSTCSCSCSTTSKNADGNTEEH